MDSASFIWALRRKQLRSCWKRSMIRALLGWTRLCEIGYERRLLATTKCFNPFLMGKGRSFKPNLVGGMGASGTQTWYGRWPYPILSLMWQGLSAVQLLVRPIQAQVVPGCFSVGNALS